MGLLFIGGLMNVLWVAAIALLVLIEKTFPLGNRASWLIGRRQVGVTAPGPIATGNPRVSCPRLR